MSKQQDLNDLCLEFQLSDSAMKAVKTACISLSNFEYNREFWKTGIGRKEELAEFREKIESLQDLIGGMDPRNEWNIGYSLGDMHFPGALLNPDCEDRNISSIWRIAFTDLLKMVDQAAVKAESNIPKSTLRNGRPSLQFFYAIQISNMALEVCVKGGLKFGRDGKFRRLCDAVFAASGVHATSEAAIKFYEKKVKAGESLLWNYY